MLDSEQVFFLPESTSDTFQKGDKNSTGNKLIAVLFLQPGQGCDVKEDIIIVDIYPFINHLCRRDSD